MDENEIGKIVVDCAVKLHMKVGPGLFESVYEELLANAISHCGLHIEKQVIIPVRIDGIDFSKGFRADLVVEDKVILELKSVEKLAPAHKKQLLTYLILTNKKLGYLLNFGAPLMKNGITRIINGSL